MRNPEDRSQSKAAVTVEPDRMVRRKHLIVAFSPLVYRCFTYTGHYANVSFKYGNETQTLNYSEQLTS